MFFCLLVDMANGTLNISLTPDLDDFVQRRVSSGRYESASEVIQEALRLLERHEIERDDALGQLKAKLERGAGQAERGDLLDGDIVFDEIRDRIEELRNSTDKTVNP